MANARDRGCHNPTTPFSELTTPAARGLLRCRGMFSTHNRAREGEETEVAAAEERS